MSDQRNFTVSSLLSLKTAAELAVTGDGRVAFTLREADLDESNYHAQLWAVSHGQEPVQLTRGDKGCTGSQWARDGRFLAFLSSRPLEKAGDGSGRAQIWLLPSVGGEAFPVTKAPFGVRSFTWAPDGRTLFFIADEGEQEAEKARRTKEKKQKLDAVVEHANLRRRQIWQVPAQSGAEQSIVYEGDLGLSEIAVSPDGKLLAFTSNDTGLWEDFRKYGLHLLTLETGTVQRLTQGTGGCYGITWSPNGSRIAFVAPHDERYTYSRSELFAVPAAGGDVANLTASWPDFMGDVNGFDWLSDAELLIQSTVGCYGHLYRAPLSGSLTRLTPAQTVVTGLTLSADRRYVAYLEERAQSVPEIWLVDLKAQGTAQRLTDLNPTLQTEIAWGEQRVIRWDAPDGLPIEGVLTLPPNHKEGERHPLLVYVHGGPHARTPNVLRQYMNFQVLAANGYAVIAPNYRGSSGYGHDFAVSNREDLGGGDWRDIMSGVDHVIALGVADGDRMGIFGGSYGGYMTNWAIGQTDRFKAAVSMFGIFSLVSDYSQSDMPSWEMGYLGGFWWENPEVYTRCAPSTYVTNMKTPVLIIHGEADNNTYPSNSKEMYTALRHRGCKVAYVHYPREGHGIAEPNHKKDEYRRVLDWFQTHIRGDVPLAEGSVAHGGNTLAVTAVSAPEDYAGRKAKGRFLEVTLTLTPVVGTLKLDLAELRLWHDATGYTWEAAPFGVAAAGVLVPSSGVVELSSEGTVALVFDLPAKAPLTEWRLTAQPFPAVAVV